MMMHVSTVACAVHVTDDLRCHCRLYMKVHNIPFEEESVELADWGAPSGKPACMKDHNPTGSLPVLFMGGKAYAEHVAMCRYLARKVRTSTPPTPPTPHPTMAASTNASGRPCLYTWTIKALESYLASA